MICGISKLHTLLLWPFAKVPENTIDGRSHISCRAMFATLLDFLHLGFNFSKNTLFTCNHKTAH